MEMMDEQAVESSHREWLQEFRDKVLSRDVLFGMLVLIVISILGARFFVTFTPNGVPTVEKGEISVSGWDFDKGPIELIGDWEFYWEQYLGEDQLAPSDTPVHGPVPGLWVNFPEVDGEPIAEFFGYATYRVVVKDAAPGVYAVTIPILYAPSRVWINGELLSQTGVLAKVPTDEKPVWKGHYAGFSSDGGDIEILLEVSDHVHGNGRVLEPPAFGPASVVADYQTLYMARDLIIQGIATTLFIFSLTLFLFRRQDLASLYFGIFCLLFGTTLSFLGVNISEIVIPGADFWTKLLIYYIAEAGSFVMFTLYISALYPEERIKAVNWAIYIVSGLAVAYVAFFLVQKTIKVDVPWFGTYLMLMTASFFYFIYIAVRASMRGREGAPILLFGFVLLVWTVGTEILLTNGVLEENPALGIGIGNLSLGFLIFLIAQVIILAQRWTKTLQTSERMTRDLSRLVEVTSAISSEVQLESLLQRIVHGATEFLQAERSTLYLYDEKSDELWSLVAEGIGNKEIRFPATSGIAGACFQTGETINVEDAYADPRFNRVFDKDNNFTTRTILTMPVESKSGQRLGVMQVLNKIGRRFNSLDEQRLRAFAAQAAISIENAELFGEVVEAKNYNESILGSMSNGVLTLDADGHVAKINSAALTILGGEEADFTDQENDIWLFSGENSWIAEELGNVRAEGQPRTLLDVDVITPDETTKSLNLSIVPLVAEEGDKLGELLLLEDITGEKRLRGTMSRFMTKEVADRILESGEDTLQGAACRASILFADLRNFTGISEELGARETVAMLNEFFSDMVEAIFHWKGVLDKFIGDSIMAVYGAPVSTGVDTDNAVRSAIEMMQILAELNLRREERGDATLDLSIGIATGEVVAGTIGSPKRMEYTVIGDSVNLAARLEAVTRYYDANIIIGEETMSILTMPVIVRELDLIRVKGRTKPSMIYEILDHHTDQSFPNMEETITLYARGVQLYRARDWHEAIETFHKVLAIRPGDRPSKIYLERAQLFQANPPPADWDGVWTMTEK